MTTDRRSEQPAGAGESGSPEQHSHAEDPEREHAEAGAESYGGDEDAGPSVTDEEIDIGMERDQAEG